MKKTTFSMILLVCFVSTTLLSQTCPPPTSGNTNTLDWENATTFSCYFPANNGAATTITSPFFQSGLGCNDNIWPFCNGSVSDRDFSSADGWRYVTHDFGTPTKLEDYPVFVLYNIYSGILRVFFYKNLNVQADAATIALGYKLGSKRTSLLGYYRNRLKDAVEVFDNSSSPIIMPNVYVAAVHWTHADFVTQYDPCTCQSASTYSLKLVATSTSNISFNINGQIKQDVKAAQSNGSTSASTTKTGIEGLNIIKSLLGIGAGSAPNSYANDFNTLSSVAGNLGLVIKAADFFLGLFDETTPAKATPLVFNANLTGSGTINTINPLQALNFNNPGSILPNNPAPNNNPTYNNVMGTFSLLQTPTIKYSNISMEDCQTYPDPDYGSYTNCYYDVAWKLENLSDIKWVLNPQSELTVDNLMASYVFTDQYSTYESEHFPLGCFNSYKPVIYHYTKPYKPDIQTVQLKITGIFSGSNNKKLVFSSLYKVNLQKEYSSDYLDHILEELPPSGCSVITPQASSSQIQAVCTSYSYTSRRDQFFKAPTDTAVKVKENAKMSVGMDMQIAPNPASNSLFLQYTLKNEGRVKIAIYDLSGKMVQSLATDDAAKEGAYSLQADLTDVASGLYFVVLDVNGKTLTQKLSVMKK